MTSPSTSPLTLDEFRPRPATIPEPLFLTLPWAVLVPDNAKYGVVRGKIILTKAYRTAKESARMLAQLTFKRRRLYGPVSVVATLYEPDRDRSRDLSNYCKLVHDALSDAAYTDDAQIDDVRWLRGPVDPKNPRCEITISPITPASQEIRP